jgi:hypothetical protein
VGATFAAMFAVVLTVLVVASMNSLAATKARLAEQKALRVVTIRMNEPEYWEVTGKMLLEHKEEVNHDYYS